MRAGIVIVSLQPVCLARLVGCQANVSDRSVTADDDSRGVKREDKLGVLERRLQSVLSNQTKWEANLQGVQSSLASLQQSVQQLNKTVSQEQTHSLANLTLNSSILLASISICALLPAV